MGRGLPVRLGRASRRWSARPRLPWGRVGLAQREAVGGRPVSAQLPDPVLGLLGRRTVPAGYPPQGCSGLGGLVEPLPALPHDLQVPHGEDEAGQRLHRLPCGQVDDHAVAPGDIPAEGLHRGGVPVLGLQPPQEDAASPSALASSSAAMNGASRGDSSGASRRETFTCARSKDIPGWYRSIPQLDRHARRRTSSSRGTVAPGPSRASHVCLVRPRCRTSVRARRAWSAPWQLCGRRRWGRRARGRARSRLGCRRRFPRRGLWLVGGRGRI